MAIQKLQGTQICVPYKIPVLFPLLRGQGEFAFSFKNIHPVCFVAIPLNINPPLSPFAKGENRLRVGGFCLSFVISYACLWLVIRNS